MTLAEYHQHERPPVMRSARPHHVLVHVRDGDVGRALKLIKRQFEDSGLRQMLRPDGRLHTYQPPSVRRRKKAAAAVARARRAARQAAHLEWRAELRGL